MNKAEIKKAFSILRVVNHPLRFSILQLLQEGPLQPRWLKKKLKRDQPTIAYHVNQLQRIGVVHKTKGKSEGPGPTIFIHLREETWQRIEDAVVNLLRA